MYLSISDGFGGIGSAFKYSLVGKFSGVNLNVLINSLKYEFGLKNGAIGGKLLGAGGGGYILFLSKDKANQKKLINSLNKKVYFKFNIDHNGSQIL